MIMKSEKDMALVDAQLCSASKYRSAFSKRSVKEGEERKEEKEKKGKKGTNPRRRSCI